MLLGSKFIIYMVGVGPFGKSQKTSPWDLAMAAKNASMKTNSTHVQQVKRGGSISHLYAF